MDPRAPKYSNERTISIVFSFRNEQEVLSLLIDRIRKALASPEVILAFPRHELIFVNDDSTDRSLAILLAEAKRQNDIRIINMSRCFGISPCALAGMQVSCGDAVIYMDADLQDPPEVIPDMVKAFLSEEGVDIIHTVRKTRRGESFLKMFLTRIGYWVLNKVTPFRMRPETGDFKLLSRRAVNHLVQLKEKKPFLRGLVYWIGFKQAFIPYERQSRYAGKTKFPILSLRVISNFFESALISFSSLPLQFASILGLVAILVDLGLLIHVFYEKFSGRAIPGWAAIMVAVVFIGSVQLFCLGILGMYINAIYEETKGRPNFIVASTYGFSEDNDPLKHA